MSWGAKARKGELGTLEAHIIGPAHAYVCGNEISIADYFGAALVTAGEIIRLDYSAYPNVLRWLGNVKTRPSWAKVNEGFYTHFVKPLLRHTSFEGL